MTAQPDPAALRALVERILALSERATAGPWEVDVEPNEGGEYGPGPDSGRGFDDFMILGADGGKLAGTDNATWKSIEEEFDDEGYKSAWDHIGKANAELIVAAVNFVRDDLPRLLAAHDDEREASEQHRNDLADKIQDQLTEIGALKARIEELHHEAEIFDADHADQNRMVDRIADLIGLPHDQELDTTAFELWFSAQDDERAADKARIARLEAALEPFAEIVETIDDVGRIDEYDERINVVQAYGCLLAELDEDTFRAARSALGGEGAE